MKREFDSVESFAQFLSDDLKDFMTELAPDVEQVLLNHIRSDIYGAYTPQSYDRRYELWDGKNIESNVSGHELTVKDMTPGSTPLAAGYTPPGNVLIGIIEEGAQGHGYGKWRKAFARPAVANAQREVGQGGLVLKKLKDRYG